MGTGSGNRQWEHTGSGNRQWEHTGSGNRQWEHTGSGNGRCPHHLAADVLATAGHNRDLAYMCAHTVPLAHCPSFLSSPLSVPLSHCSTSILVTLSHCTSSLSLPVSVPPSLSTSLSLPLSLHCLALTAPPPLAFAPSLSPPRSLSQARRGAPTDGEGVQGGGVQEHRNTSHFTDTPSQSVFEIPTKGKGGRSRMTEISPSRRRCSAGCRGPRGRSLRSGSRPSRWGREPFAVSKGFGYGWRGDVSEMT